MWAAGQADLASAPGGAGGSPGAPSAPCPSPCPRQDETAGTCRAALIWGLRGDEQFPAALHGAVALTWTGL